MASLLFFLPFSLSLLPSSFNMKGSLVITLIALFLASCVSLENSQSYCSYEGQVNLKNDEIIEIPSLNGSYEVVFGLLELCYNNTFINVCLNGTDVYIDDDIAERACRELGYYGKWLCLCCTN